MTKVYLIRHAESFYTKEDNDFDRPLTHKGSQDTEKIKDVFADRVVDHIISSPYIRAIDTVEKLAKDKNLPIELVSNFRERNVGKIDVPAGDFKDFAKKQWGDFEFSREGGESLGEVQSRAIKALNKVLKKHPEKNIAIATHGTLLGTVLNYYDDDYDYQCWQGLKMPDIFVLKFNGENLKDFQRINI
jgi:2,3-bisphosphoglycerate-dependent phosphoglycerate mutase